MYGVRSNSDPFTWLNNFSNRIFPFLLNTSTKFSSILKWKAGVSSLRCVAQRCPEEQQYKILVFKPGNNWQNLDLQKKYIRLSDLAPGANVRLTKTNQMMATYLLWRSRTTEKFRRCTTTNSIIFALNHLHFST